MKQIRNILCATDFENGADDAIRQASRFAEIHNARLTFLAVTPAVDRASVLFPQAHEKLTMDESSLESEMMNGLTESITNLTGRNAGEFQIVADSGSADAVTVRIAKELEADLVVIPDTANANRIIRELHCSVLLTRPEPDGRCVVAGTDFSDPAFPAMEAAARVAELRNFELVLVHSLGEMRVAGLIAPEPDSMGMFTAEELQNFTHEAQEQMYSALTKIGARGTPVVCHDLPATAIVRVAKERNAELIVVGTIGRSGFSRLLLGSVAESVVANAPCSVLVVRLH